MAATALKALGARGPVVTSVLVRVKVSIWLGLPKFKVFVVVEEDE
jgi:hypothetical protein